MAKLTAFERWKILHTAAETMAARVEELGALISKEEGKILAEGRAEALRAVDTIMESAEEAKRVHGETVALDGAAHGRSKFGVTIRVPCGVVVAISPFNFPLNLVCHKVGPAIAGGNAVVLKPATDTPLSALRLTEILLEAGLPPEGLNTLTGAGGEIGDRLVADRRVRKITFTGSRDIGERICKTAGIKRVTMELGSNSPVVVMPDADLDKVAAAVAATGYANAGQVCISTQRVLTAGKVYGNFLDALRPKVAALKVGNQLDPAVHVGPMIREKEAIRVEEWVRDAVASGARLVTGGRRQGALYEPTIVADVKPEMRISCDELFGPAVAVTPFNDLDEAIALANDTNYGLAAGIFTENLEWAVRFAREVSPVEVMDAILDRIERINPKLNAFVTLTDEAARREAKAAERALTRRRTVLGPLHGVPFSVKDLVVTKGVRTTFGTPLYRDNVPTEDAPMVERMKRAGAILLGKTNTPTFGWLGATHNLVFGPTRNPWDLERTPGGSSGGASAAAAAGLGPLHIGTDGGGSIRIPASFTGIFGLKASYGRIPAYPPSGAWSLSHIGPMTRTVADAAMMMNVCAGPDERDQYSLPAPRVDYAKALRGSVKGLRVAYSDDLGGADAVDPEVRAVSAKAALAFRELGCRVETVDPRWPSPRDCWEQTFCGGIATRMAPYVDRREEIEPGLYRIIEATLRNPPTRYVQAWFDRLAWWQHPREFFETYDLLLTPTIACPPFPIGLDNPTEIAGKRVEPYAWIPFTYPFNLTGQPAASVPCGFTNEGLPIGLQIVGRRFDDAGVLGAAAAFERARPWADRRPPID